MALLFTAASSQYLECTSPPITDYPWSCGMWVRLTAVGSSVRTWCALSDTGTTNNYLDWRMNATEEAEMGASAGATENAGASGTLVAGRWAFVVARLQTTASRRRAILMANGSTDSNTSTATRAPSGMDTLTIGALKTSGGASQFWDGAVAEFWLAKGDCFASTSTNPTREMMFALAYRGPFAFPYLRGNLLEYRSFRQGIVSPGDRARMKLDAVNGPLRLTDHPPLAPGYRRATDTFQPLLV